MEKCIKFKIKNKMRNLCNKVGNVYYAKEYVIKSLKQNR